jgi:ferredoxin
VADLKRSAKTIMASITQRVRQNVVGKFYVDWTCIYCDLCVDTAPGVFKEFKERGWAFVDRQPTTEEETRQAIEAVEGCPTESIGFDGDQYDWAAVPPEQDTVGAPEVERLSVRDRNAKLLRWR